MATRFIPEEMSSLFKYDPETGEIWKKAGNVAPHSGGYKVIKFRQKRYYVHRVAWLLMTGEQPPTNLVVDHIDGNRANNAWCNLRLLSHKENRWNRAKPLRGIYFIPKTRTWMTSIQADGKRTSLYNGRDFFEACCRRKSAENRLHAYTDCTS